MVLVAVFNVNAIHFCYALNLQIFLKELLPEDRKHSLKNVNESKLFSLSFFNSFIFYLFLVSARFWILLTVELQDLLGGSILLSVEIENELELCIAGFSVDPTNWLNLIVEIVVHLAACNVPSAETISMQDQDAFLLHNVFLAIGYLQGLLGWDILLWLRYNE